mmetsp:Transcript_68136/g.145837  ORF Transcript_68136/g.145837 Transcript_68136/m.145837 type:complete len:217 (+) Transcript_68136:87-737(+)
MPSRFIGAQCLSKSAGAKRQIDIADGATVADIIRVLAGLKDANPTKMFIAEEKNDMNVKLHGSEVPKADILIGGLDDFEGLEDTITVEKLKYREELTVQEALALQEDFVKLYSADKFQNMMKAFQHKFVVGDRELKAYRRMCADLIRPYQKDIYEKWGFGKGNSAAQRMRKAFVAHDDEQSVSVNAAVLNALIGMDMAWLPESMQTEEQKKALAMQ